MARNEWSCERCGRKGEVSIPLGSGVWQGANIVWDAHREVSPGCEEVEAAMNLDIPNATVRVPLIDPSKLRESIEADQTRLDNLSDPVKWVRNTLGEHLWSKQREIMCSVRDNRRTAVYSCHKIGKSFIAARIIAWWISNHKPGEASVITTSRRGRQVKAVVWKELARVHSKGRLPGRLNQTEWYLTLPDGHEEMVAFGQKPDDKDPSAFHGTHARYVLVVIDEACYIPAVLWDALDTLLGNEESRILAIGNPDDPNTEFANVCKPGSGWKSISIGHHETPNFTGERVPDSISKLLIGPTWVEEKRRKWGENNPLFISKVTGKFPQITTDGLIPMNWIVQAQDRILEPGTPIELGVDVGGGADKNVIACRRGPVVRIVLSDQNPDTMQTCGNIISHMQASGATKVKVDKIGIGWGAVDRARELGHKQVVGVMSGSRDNIDKEMFENLRVAGYWDLRDRFREGNIDIDADDDDLAAELVNLKYKRSSSGKLVMESKQEIRRRGDKSPDRADAVMYAFLEPHGMRGATW